MSDKAKRDTDGPKDLGEMVRRLRKERGLTQAELGEAVGVDESYVSKIEKRRLNYVPSEVTLRLFAKALGVNPLELLTVAEKMPHELRHIVESSSAHEFFDLVRDRQLGNDDWEDLTKRLRNRLSGRNR